MAKQVKTEPMEYPTNKTISTHTLKTWLALSPTPEHRRAIRRLLKEQARRH